MNDKRHGANIEEWKTKRKTLLVHQLEEFYTMMKQLVNPLDKELLLPYENPKSYLQASENLEALQERVLDYQKLAEASIRQVQPTTCHKRNTRPRQT